MEEDKKTIICDIDGVLFDSREWHKYYPKDNKRESWDEFQTHYDVCMPNQHMIEFICNNIDKYNIVFITARESTPFLQKATIEQIQKASNNIIKIGENCSMLMRPYNDFRIDCIVKEDLLKYLIGASDLFLAIDDSYANIEVFKKHVENTWYYDKFRGGEFI